MPRPKPSSRENGRHSHGPTTQSGKNKVRFNAVKHGILAQQIILIGNENAQQFQFTLSEHLGRFQPRDEVEYSTVVEMVRAQWCLFRSFAAETDLFQKHRSTYMSDTFQPLMSNRTLDLLPRYQARLQLAYQRAIRTLILVRTHFPLPSEPQQDEPQQTGPQHTEPQQAGPPVTAVPEPATPPHPATTPATPRQNVIEPAAPSPAPAPPPASDWPKAA